MSDKILTQHLSRKAILYVRQSSGFQVQNNEKSHRLQYAVRRQLELLGWQEIEVIDPDGVLLAECTRLNYSPG